MFVIKRDGIKESVRFDKITSRLNKLLYGIDKSIDPLVITQKISSRLYSGISTTELDILASQICMSMIIDHPGYGILGARIAISNHQKNTSDNFLEVLNNLRDNRDIHGEISPLVNEELLSIVSKYKKEIQSMISYDRDYLLDYFGFKTLERSYLLKINVGKDKKKIIERPQHTFMRVAIGIHGDDLENVKKTYDNISLKNYTHATPTLFNSGTPFNALSSCFLMGTDDNIESLFETISDCAKISKWSGGIGVHISNVRAKGSYIRKTAGNSDGILPMLKVYNDVARWINQGGGKRNGSFAIYLEPHHSDVFEFLEARKNTGSEELRARDLFYALWISDYFMECVEKNTDWYLMDPDECRGLNDVYGDEYVCLYKQYVEENKYMKKIKARAIWEAIISSQIEHGMPYISYKDAGNKKSNQKNIGTIKSSNLCNEIYQYSDDKETSCCNLASICLPSVLEYPKKDIDNSYPRISWYGLLKHKEKEQYVVVYLGKLLLYSKDDCMYCKMLKSLLDELEIKYTLIDKEEAERLRELIPGCEPFKTVPQLFSVYNDKTYYIGDYNKCWEVLKPRVNYGKLKDLAYELTINLNKVIDKNYYPTEKSKISNFKHRPIGLGVQGLQDVFMILKLPFTSDDAREINKKIFETIYYGSLSASIDLSIKDGHYSTFEGSPLSKGEFQFNLWGLKDEDLSGLWNWRELREKVIKYGSRNSLNIALMPTASTSSIFGNVESFEVITSNLYTRNVLSGTFTLINKHLVKDLISLDLWNEDIKDKLIYYKGSVQNIKEIPKILKEVYKTAFEVDQKIVIKMSAERGVFVCQSQSLNLFFENPTFKELTSCHFYGWKQGLKTGSYYIRTKPSAYAQQFGLSAEKEKKLKDEECLSCGA